MKSQRSRHDPEFKIRVVLEALEGIKTIKQIRKEPEHGEDRLPKAAPKGERGESIRHPPHQVWSSD